jgi:flavin reductase (DIM6/NTAB) family NADH-FMN oxidoreductase RutF
MPACIGDLTALTNVDPAKFKATMRCIASTVSVVTTGEGVAINGMTATAVCSVSAVPPCILIVVNQENRSHASIEKTGAFVVNVLSSWQKSLALHFASKTVMPFESVAHRAGITNSPILEGCAAYLECVVETQTKSGTHSIFVGRVVSSGETDQPPLIYRNGEFFPCGEQQSVSGVLRSRKCVR